MYAEAFPPARWFGSVARRLGHPLAAVPWRARPQRPVWSAWGTRPQIPAVAGEGPARRSPELARLEAVLFLAREPLASRKLAQGASLADGTKARTLVRELNRRYDEENCAFQIVEVAGGFQLVTRSQFAPWLRRLHPTEVEIRLSSPAMETLAVVAYRQPVVRADIEAIRGVQCGEILRQLMERDLVRIVGRSEDLGRPFLYGTSRRFLQAFGLYHLDELPRPEGFRPTPVPPPPGQGSEPNPNTCTDEASQSLDPQLTGGKEDVKTAATMELIAHETLEQESLAVLDDPRAGLLTLARKDEEDEDLDDEDDDDDDEDDDEDEEWEEVDDEDDDLEELDEDEDEDEDWEEDEEWDDDEDEEWDDEDDDEDDDWDEDEDEEEQGGEE